MKKLLAVFLAVLMLAGMGASAFAEEASGDGGPEYLETEGASQSIPVQVGYQLAASGETYYVKLEWKGLSFIYHPKSNGTWDPINHVYDKTTSAYWTSENGEQADLGVPGQTIGLITVTNNSAYDTGDSKDVTVEMQYTSTYGELSQPVNMRFYENKPSGRYATDYYSYNLYGPASLEKSGDQVKVYVLPLTKNDLDPFGDNQAVTLGNIKVTISKFVQIGDPPGPEQPGIEAVTPGPAEESAANG